MYYEINIALKGKHLFATHKRSITDADTFLKVFAFLNEKFPEQEGYTLTAEYHPERLIVTTRKAILKCIGTGNPYKVFELFQNDKKSK